MSLNCSSGNVKKKKWNRGQLSCNVGYVIIVLTIASFKLCFNHSKKLKVCLSAAMDVLLPKRPGLCPDLALKSLKLIPHDKPSRLYR